MSRITGYLGERKFVSPCEARSKLNYCKQQIFFLRNRTLDKQTRETLGSEIALEEALMRAFERLVKWLVLWTAAVIINIKIQY